MFSLSLVLAAVTMIAPPLAHDPSAISAEVTQTLRALHDAPVSGRAWITLDADTRVAVQLTPQRVLATDFVAHVQGRPHAKLTAQLREIRQLRGVVVDEPGSLVSLTMSASGAAGMIDRGEGRGRYVLQGDAPTLGLQEGLAHFIRADGIGFPDAPFCATLDSDGGVAGGGGVTAGDHKVVRLALEMDYEYAQIFALDAAAGSSYAAALMGAVSAIYERDCHTSIELGSLFIATNPKDIFNDSDPLSQFRDWWNLNRTDVDRDLAMLLSGRRNLPYGGVAWLNAACTNYGYSVCGYTIGAFADPTQSLGANWDVVVTAHEIGHNLGTSHTHSYGIDGCASGTVERGTIMSYCHVVSGAGANVELRFHRGTADPIEGFVAGAACLASDCDRDGVEDSAEIAAGAEADSNLDGIPDDCQDCDSNGVPDPMQIAAGTLADLDGNGEPDGCQFDCDQDGIADGVEIALLSAEDLDGNFIPDNCQTDCNSNGTFDWGDIRANMNLDRSRDGRIDGCEDCDSDGISNLAAIAGSRSIWVSDATESAVRELHPSSGVLLRACTGLPEPVLDIASTSNGFVWFVGDSRLLRIAIAGEAAPTQVMSFGALQGRAVVADASSRWVGFSNGRVSQITDSGSLGSTIVPAITDSAQLRDLVRDGARWIATFSDGSIRVSNAIAAPWSAFVPALSSLDPYGLYADSAHNRLLVADRATSRVLAFALSNGADLGPWDVQNGAMLNNCTHLALSGDGRALVVCSGNSSSTVNGYNLESGYTERTYRVYPSDAPRAYAIAIASASATDANGNLIPDACETASADLNGDGVVNAADLAMLLNSWGACAACSADLTGDAVVDAADLALLLNAWMV